MKKILLSLVTFLLCFTFIPFVSAKNTAKVYMFTKEGCPACEAALTYFDELKNNDKYDFELFVMEVFDSGWGVNNESVYQMLVDTYQNFGVNSSEMATPSIVIGDYFTKGLPPDTTVIEDSIAKINDSEEELTDFVSNYIVENNIDITNMKKEDNIKEPSKYDTYIIIGIFVVLIGGCAGLVVIGKK